MEAVHHFNCTSCGRCCNNHSLPLTLAEAISWLEEDGNLALFCEAKAWPAEPPPGDLRAAHFRKRSFPVSCGSSNARVTVILVGVIAGACKNLDEHLMCRIYERRPLVCRIYPAEINPFIQFNTAAKACPPDAWMSPNVLLSSDVQALVDLSRRIDAGEANKKALLCNDLDIHVAAAANEGFAAHEPDAATLLAALRRAHAADPNGAQDYRAWQLYSREPDTIARLQAVGIDVLIDRRPEDFFTFVPMPR